MNKDVFHDHLDVCEQCEQHPFSLCTVGDRLLRQVAKDVFAEIFPEIDTYFKKESL